MLYYRVFAYVNDITVTNHFLHCEWFSFKGVFFVREFKEILNEQFYTMLEIVLYSLNKFEALDIKVQTYGKDNKYLKNDVQNGSFFHFLYE